MKKITEHITDRKKRIKLIYKVNSTFYIGAKFTTSIINLAGAAADAHKEFKAAYDHINKEIRALPTSDKKDKK